MELAYSSNFTSVDSADELYDINGGIGLLGACLIVGGCVVVAFCVAFVVGAVYEACVG